MAGLGSAVYSSEYDWCVTLATDNKIKLRAKG
jgi:hypothetical protein